MISLRWLLIFAIVLVGLLPNFTAFSSEVGAESKSVQSALRRPAQSREEGYQILAATIAEFEADKSIAQQRESMIRYNYYDRFWLALGWDMDNYHQSRLADQNVIHEKYVYLIKSGRFIDSMLIAGDQVLIVEAKSARHELNNPDYIFQAKRYGWASPVAGAAVLTNFQDFRAYDTRLKPNYFKPEDGEIMRFRLHYTDYLKNFDALWDAFSYESVKKGSLKIMLDKIDPTLAKKTLDMEIVNDFNDLRILLANDIVQNNPEISEEFLNQSVQGLLNRLLLVRILEDRDIEPTKILLMTMLDWGGDAFVWDGISGGPQKSSSLYAALTKTITDRLYKKYRTPLFAAQPENRLKVSDEAIRKVILRLYPADSKNGIGCPYDFALVPTRILGTLYENFLGKRLILRNGKVTMEDRPSVRAAAGVFYTEEQIASLLVRKTVVPLIAGKTPEQICEMKFIDPANGCGAITVQVYRALENYVEEYYRKNPDQIKHIDSEFPDAIIHDDGRVQLSPYMKVKLAKTLYGVDVDSKAVEIAIVSLYIDILRDETFTVVEREQGYNIPHRSRKVDSRKFSLPDLTGNFVAANALIEPDYSGPDAAAARPFDWSGKHRIGNIMNAGGFDAVVSNPPYIGFKEMQERMPEQLTYLRDKYTSMEKHRVDLAYAFVERGAQLLNANGRLGYIITNSLLRLQAAGALRSYISEKNLLDEVVDFDRVKVFKGLKVNTALLFLRKGRDADADVKYAKALNEEQLNAFLRDLVIDKPVTNESYFISTSSPGQLRNGNWNFVHPLFKSHQTIMSAQKHTLDQYFKVFNGMSLGNNNIFVLTIAEDQGELVKATSKASPEGFMIEKGILRLEAPRRKLTRYATIPRESYIVFPYAKNFAVIGEKELSEKYPNAYAYLLKHKETLSKGRAKIWYAYSTPSNIKLSGKPKLYVGLDNVTTIDPDGSFAIATAHFGGIVAIQDDINLWMLMGLMNSAVVREYRNSISGKFAGQMAFRVGSINQIPVPAFNEETAPLYKQLEEVTKELNRLVALNSSDQILAKSQELEDIVWQLYETGASIGILKDRPRKLIVLPPAASQ